MQSSLSKPVKTIIRSYLTFGVIIGVLFSILIFVWMFPKYKATLMIQEKQLIMQQILSVKEIFQRLNMEVQKGKLPLEMAKSNAKQLLYNLRFGPEKKHFIWLLDLNVRLLMHPNKNELVEKDLTYVKDAHGKQFYREIVNKAQIEGQGIVSYSEIMNATKSDYKEKMCYVSIFLPWKWVLSVDYNLEKINQMINHWKITLIIWVITIMSVGIILSWFFSRLIYTKLLPDQNIQKRKISLYLQNFILLTIIPILIIITAIWGIVFYQDTYDIILSGFDNKLYSICTFTGCFIDGEENMELVKKRDIKGMAYNEKTQQLFGLDGLSTDLMTIDLATGSGFYQMKTNVYPVSDLACDSEADLLYTIDRTNMLTRISIQEKQVTQLFPINIYIKGFTYDPSNKRLIGNTSTGIYSIDPNTAKIELIRQKNIPSDISGLAINAEKNILYGISENNGTIYSYNMETIRFDTPMRFSHPFRSQIEKQPFYGLAFHQIESKLYSSADGFTSYNITEDKPDSLDYYMQHFFNEQTDLYLKYVTPMKKIAEKLNLTYLYSQILAEKPYCIYILDATIGNNEHTPIGYKDILPEEDYEGAERVLTDGVVHTGSVEMTQSWGLLKVSYAPIYSKDGNITSMSGADIDVTPIIIKRRNALYAVFLMAIASFLFAGLVSFIFSTKLTQSIDRLKQGALKVASGDYDYQISIQQPIEIKNLADFSNTIGKEIKMQLQSIKESIEDMENTKCLTDLIIDLNQTAAPFQTKAMYFNYFHDTHENKTASGWIQQDQYILFWLSSYNSNMSPLEHLKLRNDMRIIINQSITKGNYTISELKDALSVFLSDKIYGIFIYNSQSKKFEWIKRDTIHVICIMPDKRIRLINLDQEQKIILESSSQLILSDMDNDFGHLVTFMNANRLNGTNQDCLQEYYKQFPNNRQIMAGILNG